MLKNMMSEGFVEKLKPCIKNKDNQTIEKSFEIFISFILKRIQKQKQLHSKL